MAEFKIAFGALAKPILKQLAEQGFVLDLSERQVLHLQQDCDEVTRLKVRGVLTDREGELARKRIMAILKKQVRRLES